MMRAAISNLLRRLAQWCEPKHDDMTLAVVLRGQPQSARALRAVGLRLWVRTRDGEQLVSDQAAVDSAQFWKLWRKFQPAGQQILCEDGVPFCPDEL